MKGAPVDDAMTILDKDAVEMVNHFTLMVPELTYPGGVGQSGCSVVEC